MRTVLAILALWLVACGGTGIEPPLGGRAIAAEIVDCLEPHRGWMENQIQYMGWNVVTSASEITYRCGDTGPDGGLAQYTIALNEVLFDPTKIKTFPEFETRNATGHEGGHAAIAHSPHPEMAKLHICWWAYNDPPPPNCFPDAPAENALMSPAGTDWDGDQETFRMVRVPEYRRTDADNKLFAKAFSP